MILIFAIPGIGVTGARNDVVDTRWTATSYDVVTPLHVKPF